MKGPYKLMGFGLFLGTKKHQSLGTFSFRLYYVVYSNTNICITTLHKWHSVGDMISFGSLDALYIEHLLAWLQKLMVYFDDNKNTINEL